MVPVMARERGGIVYRSVLQGVRDIFLVSTPESPAYLDSLIAKG